MDTKDVVALVVNGGVGILVALALWHITPAIFRELVTVLRDLSASIRTQSADLSASIKALADNQAHTGQRLSRIEAKLDISDDVSPSRAPTSH